MIATIRSFLGLVVCVGLAGTPSLARGQEGMPVPKPTAEHERLAKDATIKSWGHGPDSEPTVSKGVEVVKLLPGGLWIHSEFEGKFGDQEFRGWGQTGYDTKKGKYVGTWVDSMTTELMTMEGDYDATSRTLTMYGKGTEPSGKPYDAKMTSKHEGEDSHVFTMLVKSDETKGDYVKVMEISYKRRAK
jgi:hypothetical protein